MRCQSLLLLKNITGAKVCQSGCWRKSFRYVEKTDTTTWIKHNRSMGLLQPSPSRSWWGRVNQMSLENCHFWSNKGFSRDIKQVEYLSDQRFYLTWHLFFTGMTEVGNLQDVEAPSPLIEDYPLYKTEDLVSLCLPRCCCFSHFCALPNPQTWYTHVCPFQHLV